MKLNDGNFRKTINYLKAIDNVEKLFLGLFFICKWNFSDARNAYENYPESKILKVETHFEKCFNTKNTFLRKIWKPEFFKTVENFLFFSISLLLFLDKHLYNDPATPALGNWVYDREKKNNIIQYTFPESWGSPKLVLMLNRKCIIQECIPPKKLWKRTQINTMDNLYDKGYVERFIVSNLKSKKFRIELPKYDDAQSGYPIKLMVNKFLDEGQLIFAVSSLKRDMKYNKVEKLGTDRILKLIKFRFPPLPNQLDLKTKLEKTLKKAWINRVDILIFPELTIDHQLIRIITDWQRSNNQDSRIKLIIAGSYHLQGDAGRWENRTQVISGNGICIFKQAKINRYRIFSDEVKGMAQEQKHMLGLNEKGGIEGVSVSDQINIYDTELGRIAFPICLDYINKEVCDAFIETQANLLFVPAMSPTGLSQFVERAKNLGRSHHCTSLIANSCWCMNFPEREKEVRADNIFHFYVPHKELRQITKDTFNCHKCVNNDDVCLHIIDVKKFKT